MGGSISSLGSQSDERLMALYKEGNYAAFEELYWRHSARALAYLKAHLRHSEEADEVLQRVFLKLHRARNRYDESLRFLPWLFTICRTVMIDSIRKRRAIPIESALLEGDISGAVAAWRKDEEGAGIKDLVARLPEEKKQLLHLRFREGLSFEEISLELGITPPSARKRVSRLVKSLQAMLLG